MAEDEWAARRRAEEEAEAAMDRRIDQAICRHYGVDWTSGGAHLAELAKRRTAMNRLMAEQDRADRRREKAEGSLIEKVLGWVAAAVAGAAGIVGMHYLNRSGGH